MQQADFEAKMAYFEEMANSWDNLATPERVACLSEIVGGVRINKGSAVLDVGSGTGVLLPLLLPLVDEVGKVIELDISKRTLQCAIAKGYGGNIGYLQADGAAIPLRENTFDVVICNSCFPHFLDQQQVLAEMARVLRTGGKLVICHTASREAVNETHRSIGGAVGNDTLPDIGEMRQMLVDKGLQGIELRDGPDRYLVIARKVDLRAREEAVI